MNVTLLYAKLEQNIFLQRLPISQYAAFVFFLSTLFSLHSMERRSGGQPSCVISVVPLAFIIVWALGISRYAYNGTMDYAVAELVINCVLFATALFSCLGIMVMILAISGVAYFIVNIVLFGLGFGWFKELTGYTILEMYHQLGHNAWLDLPLIQAVMYFNLWFTLVGMCILAGIIVFALLVTFCSLGSVWIGELRFKNDTPNV
jgi:hypothetical protein